MPALPAWQSALRAHPDDDTAGGALALDPTLETFLFAVGGYLAGSCPFGYWLVRVTKGVDVRTVGSGNIGATNVWRTYGRRYGAPVVLLDTLKGFAPAFLAAHFVSDLAGVIAGAAAMAGHWRPLFMGLARGGKMVATTGGVALALAPLACIAAGGVWVASFLATRYTSVASLLSAATLPLFSLAFGSSPAVVAFAAGAAIAILLLHRANIGRLLSGTENRFELGRRPGGLGRGTQRTF
jgi:glycerol-3-phosphate acyltransferase PlsY